MTIIAQKDIQHIIGKRTRGSSEEFLVQWNNDKQPEWLGYNQATNYASFEDKLLDIGESVNLPNGHTTINKGI
ncbi:hypothetical protein AKO1_007257 [Acrasis kona]|uniref:Chromo domain-containing protein n=1 Tax=Acrasis kona TaxID=1008807 RepID=A0AAW2YTH6_9EUKA